MVVDIAVGVDGFEAIEVSVEPGGLIGPSDVTDGTSEEIVGCGDEAVEVSAGSGGIDSSVDIDGRVEVFVVEASVD